MAKWETIKAGDVLYDVHRYKSNAGSQVGCWDVTIVSIDHATGDVVTCRNGRTGPSSRRNVEKLRRSRPKPSGL